MDTEEDNEEDNAGLLRKVIKQGEFILDVKLNKFYETYGKEAFNPNLGGSLAIDMKGKIRWANKQEEENYNILGEERQLQKTKNELSKSIRGQEVLEIMAKHLITAEEAMECFCIEIDEDTHELTWFGKYPDEDNY